MTSHKVRQPITNILGLTYLLDASFNTPEDIKQSIEYIKTSALSLDAYTKDLITLMSNLNKIEEDKYIKNQPMYIIQESNLNPTIPSDKDIDFYSNLNQISI